MLEITSSSNNKCKYVKSLSQKKSRQKYGEYTIEGIKSVSDALNSEREITALYVSDSFFENEKFKYPKDISLYKVQDDVFMKMCDTKAPQGILAVVKIEDETDFSIFPAGARCRSRPVRLQQRGRRGTRCHVVARGFPRHDRPERREVGGALRRK